MTDSLSSLLVRGQFAYARRQGFDAAMLTSPGPLADALTQREQATLLPVVMRRRMTPLRDVAALLSVLRALRRFRPHIVNAGTPKAGLLVMIAAWMCRVPCRIYTLRGLYMETASGPRRSMLRLVEVIACRLAHRVICVSHSLRERALELRLVDPPKAVVLGNGGSNGVDVERFKPTAERLARGRQVRAAAGIAAGAVVVGFVGRLVEDKGCTELAEAWSTVRQAFPHAHLLLVGFIENGALPGRVREMLETDSRVHLVPAAEEPADYYAASDVIVLPTYREGLPNVILEASAMELPVVATRVTGCIDAVEDGVTGTLVPPRDARSLAEAIAAYLRDPGLRAQHGRAGRMRVERIFAQATVWAALHDEYARLLSEKGLDLPAAAVMPTAITSDPSGPPSMAV